MTDPPATPLLAELAELRRRRLESAQKPPPPPPPTPPPPPPVAKTALYNTAPTSSRLFDIGRPLTLAAGAQSRGRSQPDGGGRVPQALPENRPPPPPPPPPPPFVRPSARPAPPRPRPPPAPPSPQRLKYLAEQRQLREEARSERERILRNIEEDKIRRQERGR